MFKIAYSALKEAKVARDEWESYISESMKFNKVNNTTEKLLIEIFSNVKPQYDFLPQDRHLFGSAITPNGLVNKYESILQDCQKLYLLKGNPGSGKSTLLKTISATALRYGLNVEIFHCAFNPQKYDALYIPQLRLGILNYSLPMQFEPTTIDNNPQIIDLDSFSNPKIKAEYENEIKNADNRFWASVQRAINYINKAKKNHDILEGYYIPAMNFEAINSCREKTLNRILSYVNK